MGEAHSGARHGTELPLVLQNKAAAARRLHSSLFCFPLPPRAAQ